MSSNILYFNGLNGDSGNYLLPPMTPVELSRVIQGDRLDESNIAELKSKSKRMNTKLLGPKEGVDPKELDQTGWGVIFAFEDSRAEAVKEALSGLLAHRRQQASRKNEKLYREFIGEYAYRKGWAKNDFLVKNGAAPGPADPEKIPYYLLIVGDPESIPYRFQYQLDVQYAVGRIHFDSLQEYANYARSVVQAEKGQVTLKRQATFFGVQNLDDPATKLSSEDLIQPLAVKVAKDKPDWDVRVLLETTKKKDLARLLGGPDTPSLLFTASHGMGFSNGSPRQLPHQGALVCQDWPGPEAWANKRIPADFYFSADDVSSDDAPHGLISFHFACYGAGTPALDDFPQQEFRQMREAIAEAAFIARLPQRLLGHPKGGALALIGHVERAWGYSFSWPQSGRQLQVFEASLKRLMEGHPVGSALEYFNQRYAELAADLKDALEDGEFGKRPEDLVVASMWTACNDARGYAIIGDPAVRLSEYCNTAD